MLVERIKALVESAAFSRVILFLIFAAAVIVGLETYPAVMDQYGRIIYALDWTIVWLFTLEAILKMASHGCHWHRYFRDPWNCFDFTIVVVCLLPLDGHAAAVLRLARVLRALRLISAMPKLQLLVEALLKSIPSMGYVGMLLSILFYIYAVLGVFLFRDNDPVHFGNLQLALLSLFRIVTLEDWTDIMYIQMFGSDVYAIDNPFATAENPQAQPIVGGLYFLSFVLVGTMIMLNLFIGVIINSMHEAQAEAEARKEHAGAADELVALEHDLDRLKEKLRVIRHQLPSEKTPKTSSPESHHP
ncbi:ion transporter [Mucisphaera sp.]|uniref:ion transporter n=1 Tax=Mucisphaera sp. TaxID=2913024 RepID=UPI003D0FCB3C